MIGVVLLVGLVATTVVAASGPSRDFVLVNLTDEHPEAVCLDGSPGVYYWRQSATNFENRFVVYFAGGGWCYTLEDCVHRATIGPFGSNKGLPATQPGNSSWAGGPLDMNCTVNPEFCNFNQVYIPYCDGTSFSGYQRDPVIGTEPNGTQVSLYFRGKSILDAVLDFMLKRHNAAAATEVLLTGCSAGGLATLLHADRVGTWFAQHAGDTMRRFGALPMSGFFLDHESVLSRHSYRQYMQSIYNLSNSKAGSPEKCLERFAESEQWRCMFAEYVFAASVSPTFVINSKTDMWQIPCIMGVDKELCNGAPQYQHCGNGTGMGQGVWPFPLHTCYDPATVLPAIAFGADFESRVAEIPAFFAPRNGYFINSCWTHCEAQTSQLWMNITSSTGMPMYKAVGKWWTGLGLENPPAPPREKDCTWLDHEPFICNPSCPTVV